MRKVKLLDEIRFGNNLYNFVKCNVTDLERIILRDIKVKGGFSIS